MDSFNKIPGKITYTGGCLMPLCVFIIMLILKLCGVGFPWLYVVIAPVCVYLLEIGIFIGISMFIFMIVQRLYKIKDYGDLQEKEHKSK